MKKILIYIFVIITLINAANAQVQTFIKSSKHSSEVPAAPLPAAQSKYSGTTVLVGFDMYSNKSLFSQLVDEADGILTIIFPDDGITCRIDKNGNVLEGENYIKQKGSGATIAFIQVYESKKKIVNPALDINKTLGNFMLIETSSGNVFFGSGDYKKEDQSFVLRSKPLSNIIMLKPDHGKWVVTGSDDPRIKTGSSITSVYLYTNNTRRFYTR